MNDLGKLIIMGVFTALIALMLLNISITIGEINLSLQDLDKTITEIQFKISEDY